MEIVFSEQQLKHRPQHFLVKGVLRPSPEQPQRAEHLQTALVQAGYIIISPKPLNQPALSLIHTPQYLQFLATIHQRWQTLPGASDEVLANVHPDRRDGDYPRSPVGQAGYHMTDTACPIGAETWVAAQASAASALHAADLLIDGADSAYALCRPPGHHAFADQAGGFCFINNCAVAAQALRGHFSRVAIIDIDVHHGNGTQGIFYRRSDVLTASLHADPNDFYPFFWGHTSERGHAEGLGYNLNIPLPLGTGDDDYLQALEPVLAQVLQYRPGVIIVALGLDAYLGDPLAGLAITTAGFARIGRRLGALGLPTLLVQEGGYLSAELGTNLLSFLDGFRQTR